MRADVPEVRKELKIELASFRSPGVADITEFDEAEGRPESLPVRHGDRDTVARTGCPMYRDVTPHERPHNNTAPFSAGSNDLVVSAMRVLTRRRH